MARLKACKTYYFSVEGETEYWYLKWLENEINNNENAAYRVSIKSEVQKDPVQYAKRLNIIEKTEVYHLSDYESNESNHVKQFYRTMDRMKEACSEKQIKYKFGIVT